MRSHAARVTLGVSLLLIATATLFPGGELVRPLPTWCLICGEYGGIDFILNIILFVPYGVALYLLLGRRWRAIGIGALTSLTIELLQFSVIPNRDTSLGDLTSNTLGTALGVVLTMHWRFWILPTPKIAKRLSWIGLATWLALLTLSGWALQPSPTTDPWYGQWTPRLAQFGTFRGTLLDASVNDVPLERGVIAESANIRPAFTNGEIAVDAQVITGWRQNTGTLTPIASIFDRAQREVLFFGQKGISLVYRARTHTSDLRMREPTVALKEVFPNIYPRRYAPGATDGSRLGDTIRISAERSGGIIRLGFASPEKTQTQVYPFHVFLLWNAILPFDLSLSPGLDVLSALWAIGLLTLPGYWLGFCARRSRTMPLFWGGIIVGLGGIPLLFHLPISPWWAWLASAFGLALGWFLARFSQEKANDTVLGGDRPSHDGRGISPPNGELNLLRKTC